MARGHKPQTALQVRTAAWIAAARTGAGLTQEGLAAKLGMATRNLQRIESGAQNLTLQTIERIGRALGVEPADLFPIVSDRVRGSPAELHVIPSPPTGKPPRPVPVLSLDVAAGYARTGRIIEAIGWTLLSRAAEGRSFVAPVVGRSMEPLIPDRSWSLFHATNDVDVGAIALFQLRGRGDPDDAAAFVVKRLAERNAKRVVLASLNPSSPRIELDDRAASNLSVVARWITVVARR